MRKVGLCVATGLRCFSPLLSYSLCSCRSCFCSLSYLVCGQSLVWLWRCQRRVNLGLRMDLRDTKEKPFFFLFFFFFFSFSPFSPFSPFLLFSLLFFSLFFFFFSLPFFLPFCPLWTYVYVFGSCKMGRKLKDINALDLPISSKTFYCSNFLLHTFSTFVQSFARHRDMLWLIPFILALYLVSIGGTGIAVYIFVKTWELLSYVSCFKCDLASCLLKTCSKRRWVSSLHYVGGRCLQFYWCLTFVYMYILSLTA